MHMASRTNSRCKKFSRRSRMVSRFIFPRPSATMDRIMRMAELQQALRAADPAAVLVAPRVLDRVIQQAGGLPHLLWQVPHRQCFVVDRHVLFRYVEQDELDLDPDQLLPPTVILLARPTAENL